MNYIVFCENGDVDFNESDTDTEPCNIYIISGEADSRNLLLQIQNCDDTATIQKVSIKKGE